MCVVCCSGLDDDKTALLILRGVSSANTAPAGVLLPQVCFSVGQAALDATSGTTAGRHLGALCFTHRQTWLLLFMWKSHLTLGPVVLLACCANTLLLVLHLHPLCRILAGRHESLQVGVRCCCRTLQAVPSCWRASPSHSSRSSKAAIRLTTAHSNSRMSWRSPWKAKTTAGMLPEMLLLRLCCSIGQSHGMMLLAQQGRCPLHAQHKSHHRHHQEQPPSLMAVNRTPSMPM